MLSVSSSYSLQCNNDDHDYGHDYHGDNVIDDDYDDDEEEEEEEICELCYRELQISRVPTKAKSREPAYSQALSQNKIDRQQSKPREAGRQSDGYGGWCFELR